jgi:hypothetical protein
LCAVVIGACGCKGDGASADLPPIPAAHDPKGEDLVEGAVLAAIEGPGSVGAGKYRLLKIVHVDDFPLPLDFEFHMIAYEPKSETWEEAARMWKDKHVKVTVDHFIVRKVDFMTRDYRVLFKEPITPEEQKPYDRSKITQVPQR